MRTIIQFMGMKSTKFGGLEKFILELIRTNPRLSFILVYNSLPESETYTQYLNIYDVKVEVIDFASMSILNQYNTYRGLYRKYKPDIIHFHFTGNHIGALAARSCGIKNVYKTVHSCLTYNNKEIEAYSQLTLGQRINYYFGYANRLYTKILFVSDYTMRQYSNVFGLLPSYYKIYLGVDNPVLDKGNHGNLSESLPSDTRIMTTIAFAHHLKGVDVLIKALPEIKDVTLLVIGLDEVLYTKYLRSLAIESGVADRIIWVGITDNALAYLKATDVYVQPSRTEALSLAACEALSLGVPVVGSNVGGLPEVASVVFERENHRELANVINKLLDDKQYYIQMSDNARLKYLENFQMVNAVSSYTKIYNESFID